MNTPLVSFIIPAYNEEKFIVECIESCLKQTYENVEVCITDDGSRDHTRKVLLENFRNKNRQRVEFFYLSYFFLKIKFLMTAVFRFDIQERCPHRNSNPILFIHSKPASPERAPLFGGRTGYHSRQ